MTKDPIRDMQTESFSGCFPVGMALSAAMETRLTGLTPDLFTALFDAALGPDRAACRDVIAQAQRDGVDAATLADCYIPSVAHQMGEMWCADTMGFAEVTIGVARLQSLLRDLGPEWRADGQAAANAPLVLLMSTRDAQHTLGCVLLGGQLRRRGYSVRMALDTTPEELAQLAQRLSFDAVFISASQSEHLEKLRRMVEFLRKTMQKPTPIILGGGVLEDHDDVAALTGADFATSHIDEALDHCGLTLPQTTLASKV